MTATATETKRFGHFTPRIRFNWGFWDARADRERGNGNRVFPALGRFPLPTDNKPYCEGYRAGLESPKVMDSSTPAWLARPNK